MPSEKFIEQIARRILIMRYGQITSRRTLSTCKNYVRDTFTVMAEMFEEIFGKEGD